MPTVVTPEPVVERAALVTVSQSGRFVYGSAERVRRLKRLPRREEIIARTFVLSSIVERYLSAYNEKRISAHHYCGILINASERL